MIQNSTAATASAPQNAMTLGSAIMAGPISTVDRVYAVSMLRVSDLNQTSARFSSTMASPSVTSRMFSSLPWLARLITKRCSA
ncbi:hypothetical protein D3C81_1938310 [compost metagenome]